MNVLMVNVAVVQLILSSNDGMWVRVLRLSFISPTWMSLTQPAVRHSVWRVAAGASGDVDEGAGLV